MDLDASEEPVETAKTEETSVNENTNKENEAVLPVQESQEKEDVGKFTIIRNSQLHEQNHFAFDRIIIIKFFGF